MKKNVYIMVLFTGLLHKNSGIASDLNSFQAEQTALINKTLVKYSATLPDQANKIKGALSEGGLGDIDNINTVMPGFRGYMYYLYKRKYPQSTMMDFFNFETAHPNLSNTAIIDVIENANNSGFFRIPLWLKQWWNKNN